MKDSRQLHILQTEIPAIQFTFVYLERADKPIENQRSA